MSDDALNQTIRNDQIDILVELSGHTARNRLTALAYKPAPIQVSYIGYPATTGLPTIDYRFTDEVLSPADEPSWHVESLYRLLCGSACFVPWSNVPDVNELPALLRGY
jgi:predicted O-linked N-acetylglucosamine transferase (SPINDLY family)